MNPILSTALSGLMANSLKLGNSANNVANAQTAGFTPKQASMETTGDGGVRVRLTEVEPATPPSFQPQNPESDSEGMVALPNVSLEQEMVEQKMSVIGYKANAAVVRATDEMNASLFDIKA